MGGRYYNNDRSRGGSTYKHSSFGSSNGRRGDTNDYYRHPNDRYNNRFDDNRGHKGYSDQSHVNSSGHTNGQGEVSNVFQRLNRVSNDPSNRQLTSNPESTSTSNTNPVSSTRESNSGSTIASQNTINAKENESVVEDAAALKKRLRQEKLALWKKKKEEEEREKTRTQNESETSKETSKDVTPISREVTPQPTVSVPKLKSTFANFKTGFGIKKTGGALRKPVSTSFGKHILSIDTEDDSRSRFKIPKLQPTKVETSKRVNDELDLDSLISQMSKDEQQKQNSDDSKQDEIIESEGEQDHVDIDDGSELIEEENQDPLKLLEELNRKSKKTIPDIPPSTEPFERKFYNESDFVKGMTSDEVKALRLRDGITVRGKNVQKPVLTWAQLGLPYQITSVIETMGFEVPTPIQCEALPNIMSGNDLIGIAKTGSGKTLAFLLPLFRHIMAQEKLKPGDGPLALIATPTRELALQIFKECKPFLSSLKLRGCCAYGGSSISQQIAEMKKGVHLVVCTPGRMIDLLAANSGRVTNLARVTYLVLDEADRMFDLGFEPQVMKMANVIRPDRQTVLFSATFPPKMEMLARKMLYKPVEILVGTKSVVSDTITQEVFIIEEHAKFGKLIQILNEASIEDKEGKILIFMDRQDSCDKLVNLLFEKDYLSLSLHGGKDQIDRDGAIADFKKGVVTILVATSVASRGLDVKDLNYVINYDSPTHMEDYVHRVGRTGRAGKSGKSFTFITPGQKKAAADVTRVLELSKVEVPDDLKKLSQEFYASIKDGKQKFSSGFGGKGLEKLEQIRINARNLEKSAYGIIDNTSKKTAGGEDNNDDNNDDDDDDFSKQKATDIDTSGNGSAGLDRLGFTDDDFAIKSEKEGIFFAKININDLPQEVRWAATNGDHLKRVIDETSCTIVTRGRFYASGKGPTKESDDPKLHILFESSNESIVARAVDIIRNSIIASIKRSSAAADRKQGRYTVA